MWDEKKFFEDFVKESEEIKPDPDFVNRMMDLAEEKRKKPIWKFTGYRMVAAAAAFALICVVGSRFIPGLRKEPSVKMELGLQAGKEDTPTENAQEEIPSAGTVQGGSIGDLMNEELTQLQDLLAEENCVVTDSLGTELSEEEKTYLTERIGKAKPCDNAEIKWEDSITYRIQGAETMEIRIAGEQYLVIVGDENNIYMIE